MGYAIKHNPMLLQAELIGIEPTVYALRTQSIGLPEYVILVHLN